MQESNLTVARLVEDEIKSVEVEGDVFSELLSELGIAPKVEKQAVVTSSEPGDETRAYIIGVHTVPGTDGTTQVHACTCPGFKFHQLLPDADAIRNDPETGFENLGRCKHGDKVAIADRTTEDRESGQQGFDSFASPGGGRR